MLKCIFHHIRIKPQNVVPDLQNETNHQRQLFVTILSGDIHTAGYSNIYSADPVHKKLPLINHLVASPVSYPPFSWFGEAFYRHHTPHAVTVGTSGNFSVQIAHHFAKRNVLVCSLRDYGEQNLQLKAKYYLEGYGEPQTIVFDLEKCSHREMIYWE